MKEFKNNDIFYNTFLASPKYSIVMQSGSLRINDQIAQNNESSSSINGIDFGGVYRVDKYGYTGSYTYTSSISREIILPKSGAYDNSFTRYSSILKVAALTNVFPQYSIYNDYCNMKYYLTLNSDGTIAPAYKKDGSSKTPAANPQYFIAPTASINLLSIPRDFYGDYIKPGSVALSMYVSGALAASAADVNRDGKIVETYGPSSGSVVGSILYEHGILLLTSSAEIGVETALYLQPLPEFSSSVAAVQDELKWIYFGSYTATSGSTPQTKYVLDFNGVSNIPTITMMCHAEKNELLWSNNRTYIEAGQGEELLVGQASSSINKNGNVYYAASGSFLIPSDNTFRENPLITLKNTISSSFTHYSASYQPQVFISQIGIYDDEKNLIAVAKLANPVRKTKELDYTFKIKLDM